MPYLVCTRPPYTGQHTTASVHLGCDLTWSLMLLLRTLCCSLGTPTEQAVPLLALTVPVFVLLQKQ